MLHSCLHRIRRGAATDARDSCDAPTLFSRLVRTWFLTAFADFAFSSVLPTVFYGSTFARLWQGVASVVLGPHAFHDGGRSAAIGLAMHLFGALLWSTVFLTIYSQSEWLRGVTATRNGILDQG